MIIYCDCGYMTIYQRLYDEHEKIAHGRKYRKKMREMRKKAPKHI
jgi:hypothetical protein